MLFVKKSTGFPHVDLQGLWCEKGSGFCGEIKILVPARPVVNIKSFAGTSLRDGLPAILKRVLVSSFRLTLALNFCKQVPGFSKFGNASRCYLADLIQRFATKTKGQVGTLLRAAGSRGRLGIMAKKTF